MADLSDLQAASFNKIVGSDLSGNETNAVNSDTNGNLFVKDYATGATGSAVPSNASFMGGKNPSNNLVGLITDASSNLFVNIAAGSVFLGQTTASGSLAALNAAVTITQSGQSTVTFQLTGTWTAVVSFEASNDNANWTTILSYRAGDATISTTVTNSTNNDVYRVTTAGFGFVRARVSAYTSGTVVVTAFSSWNTSGVVLNAPLPVGTNTIGALNQGLPGTIANSWYTRLSNGTTAASVSTSGDLGVNDGISSGGTQGALTLTTANTAYEVKVGASRLANRKSVTFTPLASGIYWGYTNAVTTATGTPMFMNAFQEWALDATDASVAIWVVCATAAVTGRVTESP